MFILGLIIFSQANPLITEMVGKVTPDSILLNVQRLQNFIDRSWWFDSCYAAADWLRTSFMNYGLDSVYNDTFTSTPTVPPNVVGIHRGFNCPDSVYLVVCAHFDAINEETPETLAPGADDNASGISAVLEAARILKDYQFNYNIRFIALTAEEGMMMGSGYYCYRSNERGDNIRAVFNTDMIGFVDYAPESLEVCGDTVSESLVDFFIACSDTYTSTITRKRLGCQVGDGGIFSSYGWLTVSLIEDDYPNNNPYRHSPADTIGTGFNDLSFCTQSIRSIIAALASQSRPLCVMEPKQNYNAPKLFKVWPNPLVHKGTFTFSINSDSRLSIKIYSIDGRYLATLWDGYKKAGSHYIPFAIDGLPQGLYFILMDINGVKRKVSLIIVR